MKKQSNEGKLVEAYIAEHLEQLNREVKPLGIKTLARNFIKDHLN